MFKKIISFLLFSLLSGCTGHIKHPISIKDSFVMIRKNIKLEVCGESEGTSRCKTLMVMKSHGSGAIILNQRALMKKPRTLILTAQHVCAMDKYKFSDFDPKMLIYIRDVLKFKNDISLKATQTMSVTNSYGESFPVMLPPWIQNVSADTCIVETSMHGKAMRIGEEPEFGQRLLNVAAPKGIFHGNIAGGGIYYTDGFYNGVAEMEEGRVFSMFSIIAAPGSSGSPVLNLNGEIVGMIHSIDSRFCTAFSPSCPSAVSYGATRKQVRDTILGAINAIKRRKSIIFKMKTSR